MKKIIFLLVAIFVAQFSLTAQKVDIDNYHLNYQFVGLPDNYVEPGQRTYSLRMDANDRYNIDLMYEKFRLYGWEEVEKDANIDIDVRVYGITSSKPKLDVKKEQKKNKAGKVISTTYSYRILAEDIGKSTMSIYGEKKPYVKKKKNKGKKKKKSKKKKKKKVKKEKVEEDNPFLSGVDTENMPEDEDGVDKQSDKPRAYIFDLSNSYSKNTSYYSSSKRAWDAYYGSQRNSSGNTGNFESYVPKAATSKANGVYGYGPKKYRIKFKILDSKKHPEYKKYQNAMKALKVILAKTAYNRDLEEVKEDCKPIIAYLEGITKKYTQDKKHPKRIRSSAYYNLAQLYYVLDMLDKSREVGNSMIKMEYKEKDGKKFIEKAEELKHKLAFHKMVTRHLIPEEGDEGADEVEIDVETEEEVESDDE